MIGRRVLLVLGLVTTCLALANPTARAAETSIDDLEFLQGHWEAEAFGGTIREIWLPAAGNARVAVFSLDVGGQFGFGEYVLVTESEDGVVMRFAHFNSDYTTWEGDGPVMELALVHAAPNLARFTALNEETPDEMTYRRDGDRLFVEITGLEGVLEFQRVE